MSTINERIFDLRKRLGLSQTEFADKIGSSRGVIANIDGNKTTPSPIVIMAICREFRVSRVWLEDGTGDPFLPEDEDESVYRLMLGESEFAKKVFRAMAKLPPQAWEVLEAWYKNMKAQEKKDGQS